jgi:hypothetical protein
MIYTPANLQIHHGKVATVTEPLKQSGNTGVSSPPPLTYTVGAAARYKSGDNHRFDWFVAASIQGTLQPGSGG